MKRLLLVLLCSALAVAAQTAPAYRIATPGYHWHFPADDGAHPAFANEWWYFTGNLHTAAGRRFGFELTFFRISPAPGADAAHDLYFTHFAISGIGGSQYLSRERARRGNWQQAGVAATPTGLRLWNENWTADFDASGPRHLHAVWGQQSLDLDLVPGPRMLNGRDGWSQKGSAPGEASYYYSFPRMQATGTLQAQAVTGVAWTDHEFATDQLGPHQQGWDWMGLHLPGGDLMLFNLRQDNGSRDPHSAGTWKPLGGAPVALDEADFQMMPTRQWRGYPVAWRVLVPRLHLDFNVNAELDDQEFHAPAAGVTYWEGAVSLAGTHAGRQGHHQIQGDGYLELTGYGQRFNLLQ